MNNDMNNNNNGNDGLNSEILGTVNNTNNLNNIPIEPETLETLDTSMIMPNNIQNYQSNNLNNNVINNQILNNNMANNLGNQNDNLNNMGTPVPQVVPEPAYTNPQNINPMPGFENSGTIGTTPPISLEPEKQPQKKKSNKTLFVVIIIIVLCGIGFGTYYVLKYTDLLNNSPKIEIVTKDLELNMGDSLSTNILDYATVTGTDIRNCNISTENIDTQKEGEYTYQITCGELYKTGKVTVVDNRELEVVTKKVYKTKGETLEAKEFVLSPEADYVYEFVDETSVQDNLAGEAGTYKVNIKVTSGTKTKEVEAELIVMQYKIKGYLTCESKEQNVTNSSAVMTVKERFAIVDDGNNGFGKIASEIHSFKFTDETEYTNFLAQYKTNGSITINNITGQPDFDDPNLTITITNDREYNDVITEYGENNLANYRSIKSYFETQLVYKCTYAN